MKTQLELLSNRVSYVNDKLSINTKEIYLRVMSDDLLIRKTATTQGFDNIIAKASEGSYLRKVLCVDESCKWIKIEFLIDNIQFYGFIENDTSVLKEEFYDIITFNKVYKRNLINYYWEFELKEELNNKGYKNIGIHIVDNENIRKERFLYEISNKLKKYKFKIIKLDNIENYDYNQYLDKNIDCALRVSINSNVNELHIFCIDKNAEIIYNMILPLQPFEK